MAGDEFMNLDGLLAAFAEMVKGGTIDVNGHLILQTDNGPIDAGYVRGEKGDEGTGPPGSIMMYALPTAPEGWLVCDGSAVSRTLYSRLYSVIGDTYGAGDGVTSFNLPDFRGRVPVGMDPVDSDFNAIGATGGEKTHLLTLAEMPSHTHSFSWSGTTSSDAHTHTFSATSSSDAHSHTFSDTSSSNGGHTHTTVASQVRGNGTYDFPVASGSSRSFTTDITTGSAGAHTHSVSGTTSSDSHSHTVSGTTSSDSHSHTVSGSGNTGSAGSGQAHNNLQPYVTTQYIIKT